MAFRVQFSPKSVEDLESIVEYYFAVNEKAAEEIYRLIIFKAESLEDLAERGRVFQKCRMKELENIEN
jgi:plasmid stabilization system protein ParE